MKLLREGCKSLAISVVHKEPCTHGPREMYSGAAHIGLAYTGCSYSRAWTNLTVSQHSTPRETTERQIIKVTPVFSAPTLPSHSGGRICPELYLSL